MTRPQLAAPQAAAPQTEPPKIQQLLQSPEMVKRMQAVLPRHLSPERMLRVMAQAVFKTPKLAECHPITLLGAMMACASLGLEPNTPLGHAYLIPFEKRKKVGPGKDDWATDRVDVQLIIGYKGLLDLARRSGTLESVHADVVYEGDEFSFEYGTNMHLRHRPMGERENRVPIWAYAHAKLKDGGQAFEVLPYGQVLTIRNGSQGYSEAVKKAQREKRALTDKDSPWIKHEHEMVAKTMFRRLSKWLSLSIEFANAAELDRMSDAGTANLAAFADVNDAGAFDPMAAQITQSSDIEITPTVSAEEGDAAPTPVEATPPAQRTAAAPNAAPKHADAKPQPKGKPADEPPPPTEDDFFRE